MNTVSELFDWGFYMTSTRDKSKEDTTLNSKSRITRVHDRHGISFQLFLNDIEYRFLKLINSRAYFYSNNYVFIPPKCNAYETLKALKNFDKKQGYLDDNKVHILVNSDNYNSENKPSLDVVSNHRGGFHRAKLNGYDLSIRELCAILDAPLNDSRTLEYRVYKPEIEKQYELTFFEKDIS